MSTVAHAPANQKPAWLAFSDEDLANAIEDAQSAVRAYLDKLKPLRDLIAAQKGTLMMRMIARNAERLAHPTLDIHIKKTSTKDVRLDVLRGLYELADAGKVDKADVEKVIFLHQPEAFWKHDLRGLPRLRKYGDEVGALLDKAIVVNEDRELVVSEKKGEPRDVTPKVALNGGAA